jgi:tetratricopeptide (TPR) repeat protein
MLDAGTSLNYHDPTDLDRLSLGCQLALAHVLNLDGDRAIAVAEQTLRQDPNDLAATGVLGQAELLVKDLVNAKNNLQKSGSSGQWQPYNWLSALCLIEGDLDGAEAALEDSIKINPTDALARHWIVVIQCLKGNQDTALREFDILLRVSKTWDKAAILKYYEPVDLLYHTYASLAKGDLDDASRQATELLGTGPVWKCSGYFILGFVTLLRADRAEAIELFMKASQGPAGFNANMWLAALYAYDGDVEGLFRSYVSGLRSQRNVP